MEELLILRKNVIESLSESQLKLLLLFEEKEAEINIIACKEFQEKCQQKCQQRV